MSDRLGEFAFEPEARRLLRDGIEVHLTPMAWELLLLLVRARPRAVSKVEIRRALWPDTHVGEGSLTVLMSELRSALGDSARRQSYIRTVQGYGYAFATEVDGGQGGGAPPCGPLPRVVWGRRILPLAQGENILGRDGDTTVHLDDASVSSHHAVIRVQGDSAILEDLGSQTGTYVAEERVQSPVPLQDGDVFALGEVALLFRNSAQAGQAATARRARD